MLVAEPTPGWMAFSRLQHFLNSLSIDATIWGRDEAGTDLVTDLANDDLSPAEVNRRFRGIALNRARKHRNRAQLYGDHAARCRGEAYHEDNQATDAAARELLQLVRRAVSIEEWNVLWRLAEGSSYEELAGVAGTSEVSLRTRVSRVRERVRKMV
jgi:hypothetical protein